MILLRFPNSRGFHVFLAFKNANMQNDQSVNNPWMETQLDLTLERGSEAVIFIILRKKERYAGVDS